MDLERDTIFVFGSNLAGIHGAGAAKFAKEHYGARQGNGKGIQGHSYAIPTKASPSEVLPLEFVRKYIEIFKDYARTNPSIIFQVTKIGTGLANFSEDVIAPMFFNAPLNCMLPGTWLKKKYLTKLSASYPIRVIVAGSRQIEDRKFIYGYMDKLFSNVNKDSITIVSGGATGPDTIGAEWGRDNGCDIEIFNAKWDYYPNKSAGFIRNGQMAWYSTHLVCFWDGSSKGSKHMIDLATKEGLSVKVATI